MDIMHYYYIGILMVIFLLSLNQIIFICFDLIIPRLDDYLRQKRISKVIKFDK